MDGTLIISIISVVSSLIAAAVIPALLHIADNKHQMELKRFETYELRRLDVIEGYVKAVNQCVGEKKIVDEYYEYRNIVNLYVGKKIGELCHEIDYRLNINDFDQVELVCRLICDELDIPALKTLDCKPSKNGPSEE